MIDKLKNTLDKSCHSRNLLVTIRSLAQSPIWEKYSSTVSNDSITGQHSNSFMFYILSLGQATFRFLTELIIPSSARQRQC